MLYAPTGVWNVYLLQMEHEVCVWNDIRFKFPARNHNFSFRLCDGVCKIFYLFLKNIGAAKMNSAPA